MLAILNADIKIDSDLITLYKVVDVALSPCLSAVPATDPFSCRCTEPSGWLLGRKKEAQRPPWP